MIEASHRPARGRTLQAMRTSGTHAALRSRSAPVALIVSLALGLSLAGCSGGPAPRAWAATVCTVLSPWRTEITTLTTRTQQQMTAKTTPAQAKENLVRLFGGAESASEAARAGVQKAGVPDAEHGKLVAESFTASLSAMRDAYGRARTGVEALATTPTDAFYTKVAGVVDTLNTEYGKSELDTTRLDSAELRQAFDEAPECR
jgi:hypothetical protein